MPMMQGIGTLMPGMLADLNVIDMDRLKLGKPWLAFDLPAGGKRFLQGVQGYRHTFVSGVETVQNDELTGERPGRLVRGAQAPV